MRLPGNLLLFLMFFSGTVHGQAFFKTEYFGSSSFRDTDNKRVGDAKGTATVYQGGFSVPVSVRMNENNRPTAWSINMYGSYTNFNNKQMTRSMCPDEIMNLGLSLMHIRPVNDRWSAMVVAGVGIYTPHASFQRMGAEHLFGNGGVVFVRHLKPNLDLGVGLMLNNTFGYPMVFPGAVLRWNLEGKYEVNVQMMSGIEVSAGMQVNKLLKLYLTAEMNGAMALEKIDNKKMMFTHQYVNTDLQSVFQLGKGFTLPVVIGVTPYREASYTERTLKAFFKDSEGEHKPHFAASFHFSIGLKYGF